MTTATTATPVKRAPRVNSIKPIVKGLEDLQQIRIATGNRIAANFARRNDMASEATTEKEKAKLQKLYDKIIEDLKYEHGRITDAVAKGDADAEMGKLPRPAKFKPTPLISSFSELVLVDQYVRFVKNEEAVEKQLVHALKEYPLYTEYLTKVSGVGPKIAAVLISELDPHKAKYVSSYINYAGLDTVIVGRYTNKAGTEVVLGPREISDLYRDKDWNEPLVIDDCEVVYDTVGRNRQKHCQVEHGYTDKDGKPATRAGISFNPFLKTKLIGVLAPCFLKIATTYVNDEKMSKEERIRLAVKQGYVRSEKDDPQEHKIADEYLRGKGYKVVVETNRFAEIYYKYKARIENSTKPTHQDLTPIKIHNRSMRYMIKEFLRELYIVSRHLEGLPIYQSYEQAKLGYSHVQNEWLMETFGIDTTKFEPLVIPGEQPELADKYAYPKAIAEYLAKRNEPCLAMAA